MDQEKSTSESTALVYDFLLVPGGAERVTLELMSRHLDWPLYTGFVDPQNFGQIPFSSSRLHQLTTPTGVPGWQGLKVMNAFRRRGQELADFDKVLFSGVYATRGTLHRPAARNFYYCHTPPRFAFDLADWYLQNASSWQRPLLKTLARRVRSSYAEDMTRMGHIAVNSENVANRLSQYLGITDTTVIYPPVQTRLWSWAGQDDYYLSNARLEPLKRVEWAIRAFQKLPEKNLVVTSGGSELKRLQDLARGHENIRFTGWCSEEQLQKLTGNCIASVYLARDEDFGMSPVEAMAAGKPVIGMAEGGLKESVVEGSTGVLIPPSGDDPVEALIDAVKSMTPERARSMRQACQERAQSFSPHRYHQAMDAFMARS